MPVALGEGGLPFVPVVLSGGSGTRLWPLSRASYPKQLLPLLGEHSQVQQTVQRAAQLPGALEPLLVCNSEHRFLVRDQLLELGIGNAAVVLEPAGRNTAPAVALAALHLSAQNPQTIMMVLPSDHVVDDVPAFHQAVANAKACAQLGFMCAFGVTPHSFEPGYGYLLAGEALRVGGVKHNGTFHIERFVEKPNAEIAQQLLNSKDCYWNSGMFFMRADVYLAELQQHRPDIMDAVRQSWAARQSDLDFIRPDATAFLACPSESIDYAVMQPTKRGAMVIGSFGWSDIGSWSSLWDLAPKDAEGNVTHGDVFTVDTQGSYVRAQSRLVAVVGLSNVAVVETSDAVLVVHKDQAQQVRRVTQHLEQTGRAELLQQRRVHRPWGWYESIDHGERFQVKRIMVHPGAKLSLQMHHHRAEHWVVVSGTALVTVDGQQSLLAENQSTYIPLGHSHRLENPGKLPLHLIEVQSGSYLGEDDIVRLEDQYHRAEPAEPPCTH